MIDGVKVKELKIIPDDRGRLMEIFRRDDEIFQQFGQVYITTAYPGVAKAWHYHKIQTDNFTCVKGAMKLALYDARADSPTFKEVSEFVVSLKEPRLIRIPPLVYHGFKCISAEEAMVINTPTEPYNREKPDEYKIDPYDNDIPYDWRKQ